MKVSYWIQDKDGNTVQQFSVEEVPPQLGDSVYINDFRETRLKRMRTKVVNVDTSITRSTFSMQLVRDKLADVYLPDMNERFAFMVQVVEKETGGTFNTIDRDSDEAIYTKSERQITCQIVED